MAKLTKPEAKMHAEAVERLAQPELSDEDKEFIRRHWQEGAEHLNTAAGAFFTPWDLALDFALEVGTQPLRVIDLCAGSGALSAAVWERQHGARLRGVAPIELVCVELNPGYIDVGRKLLPEATWVEASVFDLPELGHFDVAISNPPFGRVNRGGGGGPRYTGSEFDYHVIDVAASLADSGAFILPAGSAPFRYSGAPHFDWQPPCKYEAFARQTGICLDMGLGIDTTAYDDPWHGVSVKVEVVTADFSELSA